MSLKKCAFPTIIDSSERNIANDFLQPALATAIRYDRGVGFFSAGWLSMIVDGMLRFAENNGRARIITSPILTEADWKAMQTGVEARTNDILRESLESSITDLRSALSQNVLTALSWLVADDVLTFKLAVPVNKLSGEFHAKFGIFTDKDGNQVSFEGSNNETINGIVNNYESFKIFSSWVPEFAPIVKADIQRFERLWNNEDSNLRVYNLPEAARQAIIKLRQDLERPYEIPERLRPTELETKSPSLWKHQEDAIAAWEENGRIGILSMATGSGKTRTALAAAERCPELSLLIIAVPKSNLVTQWAGELSKHTRFPSPVLVFDASTQWQDKLFDRIRAGHRQQWSSPLVIIGNLDSLSGNRFQTLINDAGIPENTLLIVDEVHNAGAPIYRKVLDSRYRWRMGLSATPVRHFDEIGTSVIHSYFQETVFVYSMRDALTDGYLTPYDYHVYAAELTEDEYDEYLRLTQRIIMLRQRSDNQVTYQSQNRLDGDHKDIEMLLMQRARILKKTASKKLAVAQIIDDFNLTRSLIYCADTEQLEDIRQVIRQRQLPHTIYIGSTPQEERESALDALSRGNIPILLAIDCLDEGVDVPAFREAVIIASSTNKRQFIQRRGRVLRRSPEKSRAILIDVIAIPPLSAGSDGKKLLSNELARAKEMAELAENRHEALMQVQRYTEPFGVMLSELLSGETDE
ncbi:MAG: hypothetical protein D6711_06860 [Chloroflexi bacterium]|nr:MAG: hypothetical protein D6711_06860 [Chloroflexota bacterium]